MAKLTREQKIEIYHKRKAGATITSLSKQYKINKSNIKYLIKLTSIHGENILRKDNNTYYSDSLKQEIINKVLINKQSLTSTSLKYGLLSNGMLFNWIKSYIENGYNIVKKKQGKPTMKKIKKPIDLNDKDAIIKAKDEEILRLKAENEYLKKIKAVIQSRKNQQPKIK